MFCVFFKKKKRKNFDNFQDAFDCYVSDSTACDLVYFLPLLGDIAENE